MYDILELNEKLVSELKEIARLMDIQNYDELRRQELIYKILDQQALNPSSTATIKESLTGKDFGSEKAELKAAEQRKPDVIPSPAKEEKTPLPAATSDHTKSIRRKRISPVKKEMPVAEGFRKAEPSPVQQEAIPVPK